MQTALAWLTMWDPHEGVTVPVSKGWDFGSDYVLFGWDSYFVSHMIALSDDPRAKDIAYSTAIQITKASAINPDGTSFVPNYASGSRKSRDRTEPMVGSRAVLEIYRRHRDVWLVQLLFDDLLAWNTWTWTHRRGGPLRLVVLGSDPNPPVDSTYEYDTMQAARYESGLDNSPMYDGEMYDGGSHHMRLYDVGMTALFIADCEALAALADAVGRPADAAELRRRMEVMSALAQKHLWHQQLGVYANKRSDTGEFAPRLTPTSFYAMISGVPSGEQVAAMMNVLSSPEGFCVRSDMGAHTAPLANLSPLLQYWHAELGVPAICGSQECVAEVKGQGYTFVRVAGYVLASTSNGGDAVATVALHRSVRWGGANSNRGRSTAKNRHGKGTYFALAAENGVQADPSFVPAASRTVEGHALMQPDPTRNTEPLTLVWCPVAKQHHVIVGSGDAVQCPPAERGHDAGEAGAPGVAAVVGVLGHVLPAAENCQYALPSVARSDAGFGGKYWRGPVWGPMVQLVYWGLKRYAGDPEVDAARAALVAQSRDLLLREWRTRRHVHENYDPLFGVGCGVSSTDPFYSWGALLGFVGLLEAGHYDAPPAFGVAGGV